MFINLEYKYLVQIAKFKLRKLGCHKQIPPPVIPEKKIKMHAAKG